MASLLKSPVGAGLLTASVAALAAGCITQQKPDNRPNIIYILADDLGYGDLSCYGATRITTPNCDRLAREGMRFTDTHSNSAVSTPTRYGILTGRYCWRSWLKNWVLWENMPLLIDTGRLTVPGMLKQEGYTTGCIGKWHLGWGNDRDHRWSGDVKPGPREVGFDYFFGVPHSHNSPPWLQVYMENSHVTGLNPGENIMDSLVTKRIRRKLDETAIHLSERAVRFIMDNKNHPFFLYYPVVNIHIPQTPNPRFQGTTSAGVYGDCIAEFDWAVGEILKTLDDQGLTDKTIVILTSDNGASSEGAAFGLKSNGPWRGEKCQIYEGGHRVPFIVRWPGKVKPGKTSDETICLTDLMATCAEITGFSLPENSAEDSYSILPVLLGRKYHKPLRDFTIHHSLSGQFAIRRGKWKLINGLGNGGPEIGPATDSSAANKPERDPTTGKFRDLVYYFPPPPRPAPGEPEGQLFDLEKDPGENTNLWNEYPAIVADLQRLLEKEKMNPLTANLIENQSDPFPIIDLHVHIKGDLSIEAAVRKSRNDHVQYGIAVNCGKGFPVVNDNAALSFLESMKKYPQFFIGMQAEGREWINLFSKETIDKFDYVFTDAMTFTDGKGRRNRIWIKDETWIEDEQEFMDAYVKTIRKILDTEPINIYVNPTFLPEQMAGRYNFFWTEKRMNTVIRAARRNHIAIEINNRYRLPSEKFIRKAKTAGVKFTIGTNNSGSDFSKPEYALEMIRKCGLAESDFYKPARKNRTVVTIKEDEFCINDQVTYPGRYWKGHKIEGLLMNSRMVQGIFDDLNPQTVDKWIYPDTRKWDPDRNTDEFVLNMKRWNDCGLLSFTINLQGGSPQGYSQDQPWHNSSYREDGSLRPEYMKRLERILDKADELGMVPILGLFYFGQDQHLKDETAVRKAVKNVVEWLFDRNYRNVLIEINNECNIKYDHEILQPDRVHELIEMVKQTKRNGYRYYAGTSYDGRFIPMPNVVKAADFILLHGNGENNPENILSMVQKTRAVDGYIPKPILFNEDDHFDFDKDRNNFIAAISGYASWGYFDYRMTGEGFEAGYQSVPVDWGMNSVRKKGFFSILKAITGY